jgi:hypothetical protein
MVYRLTMALVSEAQEGNLGTDWKYQIEAKVFCSGLLSDVSVDVPKHQLEPGSVISPHGAPEPVLLFEGECEGELLLRLRLVATEVDLFINDEGRVSRDIRLQLPAAGETASVREIDLAAGVRESPGIRNRNAVFTLRIRLTLEHVA